MDPPIFSQPDLRGVLYFMATERLLHCGLLAMGHDHMFGAVSNGRQVYEESFEEGS